MPNDFMFWAMASDLLRSSSSSRRSVNRPSLSNPTNSDDMAEVYAVLETMMDAMESMASRIKELESKAK